MGSLPVIFRRPYVGVLVWSWLSYMNPHRLTWGFAYDFPFAQIVGLVTIVAMLFDREKKHFPLTGLTGIWIALILWMNVTTLFALEPDYAWHAWDRTMKIQLFSIVSLILMKEPKRLHYLVCTIVICVGFFGVKGGIFSVLTGGQYLVWGPPGSFIEGNNAMGLAMVMVIPLMWYLARHTQKKYLRLAIYASIGITSLAILTTHSRGALLAIAGMLLFVWFKSRKKAWLGIVLIVAVPVYWLAMPQEWRDRMETISEYEQDGSAMGRINAWYFAYEIAKDRPLVGGGFDTFTPRLFQKYAPQPEDFHDAHSIYFEVLGEHGFVGLALFLGLGLAAMRTAGRTASAARLSPDTLWISDLAAMLQASIIGYAIGGGFLGLAYFDLYYHLVVIIILLRSILSDTVAAREQASVAMSGDELAASRA